MRTSVFCPSLHWCAGLFVVVILSPVCPPARAQMVQQRVARSSGNIVTVNFDSQLVAGFGAAATHARAGGNASSIGATLDPPGAGLNFDDQTTFGPAGNMVPALSNPNTALVGRGLSDAYSGLAPIPGGSPAMGTDYAPVGRTIIYRVDATLNKLTHAPSTSASATARQTTASSTAALQLNPFVNSKSTATARVVDNSNPSQRGYAVGIIRDPSTYQAYPSTDAGSVLVSIGDNSDPLLLQADGAGAFASVFFDLGTDRPGDSTLISFSIWIDSSTQAASQADIEISDFNPDIGWATSQDFKNYLLTYLSFNSMTHTLSATGGIPLYQAGVGPNGDEVTLSYTDGTLAGLTAVPEPGAAALSTGLCVSLLLIAARRRGRKYEGACRKHN
jgi:hypothetical protein